MTEAASGGRSFDPLRFALPRHGYAGWRRQAPCSMPKRSANRVAIHERQPVAAGGGSFLRRSATGETIPCHHYPHHRVGKTQLWDQKRRCGNAAPKAPVHSHRQCDRAEAYRCGVLSRRFACRSGRHTSSPLEASPLEAAAGPQQLAAGPADDSSPPEEAAVDDSQRLSAEVAWSRSAAGALGGSQPGEAEAG
jgi:hypothetical protein